MAAIDKISNKVSAVPLQSGWVIFMVIALVLGLKLKWFRARLRFNDQPIQNSTSVLGTYRPTFSNDDYFETRPNSTIQQNVPQTNATKPIDNSIPKSVATGITEQNKKRDANPPTNKKEAINPKYEKNTYEKLTESTVTKTVDKNEKQKTKQNLQVENEKQKTKQNLQVENEKQKTKQNQQVENEKQKAKQNQQNEKKTPKIGKKVKAPISPVKKVEDIKTEVENWPINIVQTKDSEQKIQSNTNTGVSYSAKANPVMAARTSTMQFSQAAASIFMMDDDAEEIETARQSQKRKIEAGNMSINQTDNISVSSQTSA